MSKRHGGYIYHNSDDTMRINIFRRSLGFWDADIWVKDPKGCIEVRTWSSEVGDIKKTKRDMKKEMEHDYGKLTSMGDVNPVTDGWDVVCKKKG